MRIKRSFLRNRNSGNSIPLHHQQLLSGFLKQHIHQLAVKTDIYVFSSMKGTSKVQSGFMQFLSSKVTLAISSNNDEFVESLVKRIFEEQNIEIGKLSMMPKSQELIVEPQFQTKMKYVCISPIVLSNPEKDAELAQNSIDPSSHQFSDMLYNSLMDRMEKAGFSNEELDSFAVFEVTPDKDYVSKIVSSGKKFARIYKDDEDNQMMGYLLPFALHAHPKVHKFIWDCGIGLLNNQGYGMIDLAKEESNAPNPNQV